MTSENNTPSNSARVLLAMGGGLGMTITIVALGIGVTDVTGDNASTIGLLVIIGLVLMFAAILAWFFTVQPHKHFDDINQPLVEEEHH